MNDTKEKITRTIVDENGNDFTVHQHIITKNWWEYYLGEADKDGVAFGFVMGFENEWGDVWLPELEPYIQSQAQGQDLYALMPPEGYSWKE